MQTIYHKNLASGHWQDFSLAEQLGNIGSEVSRATNWQEKGSVIDASKAVERALELLDLTLDDKRWRTRLKEIARSREVLVDTFYGNNSYKTTLDDLNKYFYHFAFYARNK